MPNQQVSNPSAENLKVTIYGEPSTNAATIDLNGNLLVTGLLNVTANNPIQISAFAQGGATIANTVSVSIPDTVSVCVSNPILIPPILPLVENPIFNLGGLRSISMYAVQPIDATLVNSGSINVIIIDVAAYTKFTYYIETPASLNKTITMVQQISFTTALNYFVEAPGSTIVEPGKAGVVSGKYMKYSRLILSGFKGGTQGGSVTIFFQAQV